MDLLKHLWERQVAYNERIRAKEKPDDFQYWMKNYLLGVVSEMDEILQEINWKAHRRGHEVDKVNLGRELADLTKYVICAWEVSGFSSDDMLHYCMEKSMELEEQYRQDFSYNPKPGAPIIVTDIDGTLGDWRAAFRNWCRQHGMEVAEDAGNHLSLEIDLGIPYSHYAELKSQFESTGGYINLPVYLDTAEFLKRAKAKGFEIVAFTARPASRYSRIWSDTWNWLVDSNLVPTVSELRIGLEERISYAARMQETGHSVLMLDDDPTTALRASNAGIPVALRHQPYNSNLFEIGQLLIRVIDFGTCDKLNKLVDIYTEGK